METTTTPENAIQTPVVDIGMRIHKPVAEVFAAFVDPAITSRFWFSRGSARLEPNSTVTWYWDWYGVSAEARVLSLIPDQQIEIAWPGAHGETIVRWEFRDLDDGTTYVSITNRGFTGDAATIARDAVDATDGFALVLAGAKFWLEHGVEPNLVADRFPPATPAN